MELLHELIMGKPLWMWVIFIGIVLALLVLDLGVLHRKTRVIGITESLRMSVFYIGIAFLFGGWVWHQFGPRAGTEYITGFLVEKTLTIDNVFVISLVFAYFAVPPWDILGVIVLRAIMIGLGATLVSQFAWVWRWCMDPIVRVGNQLTKRPIEAFIAEGLSGIPNDDCSISAIRIILELI